MTTIFSARKIITMNPNRPEATHVAVRDGRILGVGSLEELHGWGDAALDDRFSDKVLMPGLVEGHAHTMEGTLWRYTYCGYFDRMDPDGRIWHGAGSIEAMLDRLKEAEAKLEDPDAPLPGWSLDPIYYDNRRVSRQDLDKVSSTRPIGILHASGHIMNVNTRALELAGLLRTGHNHPGLPLGEDNLPTGELKGPDVMMPVGTLVGFDGDMLGCDERGLRDFAKLCVRSGVTTVTDLAASLDDDAVDMMLRVTGEDHYPARVVPLRYFLGMTPRELLDHAAALQERSTDRLRLGMIKVVVDGSIQGFSARLRWPGYYNGAPNGLWYTAPEQLQQVLDGALQEGLHVHTHTNGDEATELVLETMGPCPAQAPRHLITGLHCSIASWPDTAQFRRMSSLGMCVNLFANHHFFWGDEHYRLTVGPGTGRANECVSHCACKQCPDGDSLRCANHDRWGRCLLPGVPSTASRLQAGSRGRARKYRLLMRFMRSRSARPTH